MQQYLEKKKVVFISTKNLDYIRNSQEINLIESSADRLLIIGSEKKSYFLRLIKIWFRILFTDFKKYDTVFIGFAPQLVLPFFNFKFKHNVVIEDFFISFFDTLCCDRKKFPENSIAGSLLKKLDKRTLDLGDMVICDTMAHGNYFCDELGCAHEKIQVLYLEADRSVYYPRIKKNSSNDAVNVLYFGTILPLQGVDIIIQAVNLLKDRNDICFEIIGPIPNRLKVDSPNVKYYKWLSQTELAEHIANSDLCLAGHFAADIEKAKRTIPGKAFIYEAMEKPMILGENSANRERYRESDKIWFVKMGDPEALALVIRQACTGLKSRHDFFENSDMDEQETIAKADDSD